MIEFKPGDVWRRETKADTELLVLRAKKGELWQCVAVSIGKVSGYSCTLDVVFSEDDLVEKWEPLVPNPEFYVHRLVQAGRRVLATFAEECDPWMTPRENPNSLGGLVPEAGDDG